MFSSSKSMTASRRELDLRRHRVRFFSARPGKGPLFALVD